MWWKQNYFACDFDRVTENEKTKTIRTKCEYNSNEMFSAKVTILSRDRKRQNVDTKKKKKKRRRKSTGYRKQYYLF